MIRTNLPRLAVLLTALAVLALAGIASALLLPFAEAQQDNSVPAKPTGLSAEASHNQVVITWDDPQDRSIRGYQVLRLDLENQKLETIESNTRSRDTTYTDDTVEPLTRYEYSVKAMNSRGGTWSDRVRTQTPAAPPPPAGTPAPTPEPAEEPAGEIPGKPADLAAVAFHDHVILSWDDPQDDTITGYEILRRDKAIHPEGTFITVKDNTGTSATTYTDDEVDPETRYVYRIKALNAHGKSGISSWVRGYTPAAPATEENTPATGIPTISGTARVGETLSADTSGVSDDDGLTDAAFGYQWLAVDAPISGATGSTYTLVSDDEGKAVKVRVSFTDDAGNEGTLTSAATDAVASSVPTKPPAKPSTLTALEVHHDKVTLTWRDPQDNTITGYVILRRDKAIHPEGTFETVEANTGTAETTYTDTRVYPEKQYVYRIKAKNAFDDSEISSWVRAYTPAAPTVEPNAPAITGTAQVGETLTADTSTVSDGDGLDNAVFTYQWLADDSDIPGATGSSYTLTEADEGKAIAVRVSFTDDAGNQETLSSASTGPVSAGGAPTAPPEALQVTTGASQELVVLWEAPPSGPLPTAYKVQWKSGTEDFDGSATSTRQALTTDISRLTYTIAGLRNGTQYAVRVTGYSGTGDGPASAEETATPEAPNVIVIFTDDLGYNDVSFNGAEQINTPNLDRLAAEGVIFTNGYVTAPVCSSSRSGLLTGRYPARFGMEMNLAYNPFDQSIGLPIDEKLLPFYLDNAGYYSGAVGKWHLGGAHRFTPLQRGFDYFYGFLGGSHDYWKVDASDPGNQNLLALLENKNPANFNGYLTDALTDKAIEFVNEERNQPFFLFLPYNAPHGPFQAPRELKAKYGHIRNHERRTYLAMVDSLDQNVGRLLEALEQSGKRDNTIIFFLSDNGGDAVGGPIYVGYRGEGGSGSTGDGGDATGGPMDNGELRDGKRTLYEGGIRVPFVASWPARWPQGQTFDPPVISLDIAATVLGLAKATVTDQARPIDGVNLDPYLRGEQEGHPHEALFWRETLYFKIGAVRSGDMKLIQIDGGTPMLFNLADDIGEEHDLFASDRETAVRLANLWNQWNGNNVKGDLIWDTGAYMDRFKAWLRNFAEERSNWVQNLPLQQIVIN